MKKYRYVYSGSIDTPFGIYNAAVQIPIDYGSYDAAEKNNASCRFEIEEGHIVLNIYSDWYQGTDEELPAELNDEKLKSKETQKRRCLWFGKHWHEGCCGNVIATFHDNENERNKIAIYPYKDEESTIKLPGLPYLPTIGVDVHNKIELPWDELFNISNLKEGWHETIGCESYSIDEIECENE